MLKEGQIVRLTDGNKYIIIKSLLIDGAKYYYVLQATGESKNFKILVCRNEVYEICEDERIYMIFAKEIME